MPVLSARIQRRLFAPIYALSYLLIAAGGVLYLFQPAPSIVAALGSSTTLTSVWAVFVAVGALICSVSYRHRNRAQYIGLPLLITAFGLLGVALVLDSYDGVPRPSGFLFLGIGGLLHAHWRVIAHRRQGDGLVLLEGGAGDSN